MKQSVCIMGLGYVGLPTAVILASQGYRVHGVDIDVNVLDAIHRGALGVEPGLDDLWRVAREANCFTSSHSPMPADVFMIAVPTPLGPGNTPDLAMVLAATDMLAPYLTGDELICIESTCPVGTTEAIAARLSPREHVAYCPERLLPGRIIEEILTNDRVVGGITQEATDRACAFYRGFITGEVVGTDARTAEMVKLAENAYRDVNIAFANELSMLASRVGVDARNLVALANRHPRVNILEPGVGVGGHCIAIDPWFLVAASPGEARLTRTARGVNLAKTAWVTERIREHIQPGATVACLGLTYKPDVDDLRESPALSIAREVATFARVLNVDPYVADTVDLDLALDEADVIVGLVAHSCFRDIPSGRLAGKVVLDFAGVLG